MFDIYSSYSGSGVRGGVGVIHLRDLNIIFFLWLYTENERNTISFKYSYFKSYFIYVKKLVWNTNEVEMTCT